jgi:hypothetical protein
MYDPKDLLKLHLYGYMSRTRSSRRLETESGRNLEPLRPPRALRPDRKTTAEFRRLRRRWLDRHSTRRQEVIIMWETLRALIAELPERYLMALVPALLAAALYFLPRVRRDKQGRLYIHSNIYEQKKHNKKLGAMIDRI